MTFVASNVYCGGGEGKGIVLLRYYSVVVDVNTFIQIYRYSTGMISDLESEYPVCSVTSMTAMLLFGALKDDFIR